MSLEPGSRCGPGRAIVMLVTDAVATTLTKLGRPRHAETPRSGDIPERWPTRRTLPMSTTSQDLIVSDGLEGRARGDPRADE